ncbi:MAG: hypothetical protein R2845_03780 [Thermomicrobiales bacterium]
MPSVADGESAAGVDGAVTVNWVSGAGSLEKVMPRNDVHSVRYLLGGEIAHVGDSKT